jgi:hypothetical protein
MAAQDKTTFEGTFNNSSTGLFKPNTTKDIGSDDLRTLVDNLTDSVPFNEDDRYTWSFPQVSTTGTNTYAATPSPAITAYSTGQAFKIKFTEASSGASTLNLNGLGAKKLYVNPTTQATTGDIVDEQVYLLIYDAALDTAAGGFLMIGGGGATAAKDVTFTPAGNIAATDVQAAIEELDSEKADITSASASTAGGTITLDMSSQKMKMFVGSASFATPKTIAMSNTTGSLVFNLFINVTNVAAVLTVPADWFMSDIQFDGTAWTPPETGRYELGGSFDGTNWWVKIQGPFS